MDDKAEHIAGETFSGRRDAVGRADTRRRPWPKKARLPRTAGYISRVRLSRLGKHAVR